MSTTAKHDPTDDDAVCPRCKRSECKRFRLISGNSMPDKIEECRKATLTLAAKRCWRLHSFFGGASPGVSERTCVACNAPVEDHRDEPCPNTQDDVARYCIRCGKHSNEHQAFVCDHPNWVLMGEGREWCSQCGAAYYDGAWTAPLWGSR